MEQKSASWLEWRNKGLGSSDAPTIMNVSPWSTPYKLWEEKTGKVKREFTSNFAMDRGNRLEPIARARYEFETGNEAPPTLFVHPQHPFIRSSLDGYVKEKGIILEIKCPGKNDHECAVMGMVPVKYYPQIQHQLLTIPEATMVHYYSFNGETGVLVEVPREEVYQKFLFAAESAFWNCVQNDVPPELTERDFHRVNDVELRDLLDDYEQLTNNLKNIEKTLATVKKKIFEHPSILGKRVLLNDTWKINITHRRGNIDYANIPTLEGLNLEPWRKPGTSFRTITKEN